MAKLSKYFLGAFALGFSDAAVNYETISCNNDEKVSLNWHGQSRVADMHMIVYSYESASPSILEALG